MTMQIPDALLFDGTKHNLPGGGPLMDAWSQNRRPKLHWWTSACWRGFVATWVVDENRWLRVASVLTGEDEHESLYKLFPRADSPVAATWYTGELLAGYGEDIERPHIYIVVYPHYRIFGIERGRVISVKHESMDWWYQQHPDIQRDGKMRGIFDE